MTCKGSQVQVLHGPLVVEITTFHSVQSESDIRLLAPPKE